MVSEHSHNSYYNIEAIINTLISFRKSRFLGKSQTLPNFFIYHQPVKQILGSPIQVNSSEIKLQVNKNSFRYPPVWL